MSQYDQSNSFYGNGGGGGGYLQGGSPFSQSGSPSGGRRTEISQSLRPLTIAQLSKASQAHTDAEWRVDDVEIGQVTVVGQVASIQTQTTNCVYSIDDGTGRMEARHWIDSSTDEDASKWGGIEEGAYVRVTGGLKSFGKKRYINATHIRNAKDPHEVYFHILEAIAVNLIIERGPPSNPSLAQRKPANVAGTGISAYAAQNNSTGVKDQFSHLPPLQRSIVRFIMDQPPRDEGVHVAMIAKAIGASGEDARKISDALDKLMDDGHVFTTIDDSHFNVSL
ncbi:hypothetical protein B0H34DRAFT_320662 [Crassisporium funariophilum]|nr:hypothetical protein B0H34DRAFT_320662 [Crassisporium funariophilum]